MTARFPSELYPTNVRMWRERALALRWLKEHNKLTTKEMARRLGISRRAMAYYLMGRRPMPWHVAATLQLGLEHGVFRSLDKRGPSHD